MILTRKGEFPFSLENFARFVASDMAIRYDCQVFTMDNPGEAVDYFFEKHPDLKNTVEFRTVRNSGGKRTRLKVKNGKNNMA